MGKKNHFLEDFKKFAYENMNIQYNNGMIDQELYNNSLPKVTNLSEKELVAKTRRAISMYSNIPELSEETKITMSAMLEKLVQGKLRLSNVEKKHSSGIQKCYMDIMGLLGIAEEPSNVLTNINNRIAYAIDKKGQAQEQILQANPVTPYEDNDDRNRRTRDINNRAIELAAEDSLQQAMMHYREFVDRDPDMAACPPDIRREMEEEDFPKIREFISKRNGVRFVDNLGQSSRSETQGHWSAQEQKNEDEKYQQDLQR